jgi:crotonobetainyl-CoA:carnitine CoA-transferase CaiB-like acyl-CoA transferase
MLALEGLKILDLSNYIPGALCTMILADFGAEVIKIEPVRPFPTENVGYSPGGEEKRKETAYFALNRNKKSIGINLRAEAGKEIFYRLARDADVVIEGYRPGVVERLGVDYITIAALNPRIIYCSLSGYGQDGPYRLNPGHDINYISMAGVLGLIGPANQPPSIPLNLIADFAAAPLYSAIGILLAYIAREKTGKGQYIDHSYLEGAIHMMAYFAQRYFFDGTMMRRGESWAAGTYPYYAVYETKDGKYLSIACLEPSFWENLCRFFEREDYIPYGQSPDDTYKKPDEKQQEIFNFLRRIFLTKTRDEWFDLLAPKDIPITKVYSMDEVFTDPQVIARNIVIEVDDPSVGKIKQVGVVPKLSETPGTVRFVAPLQGDHTDEILSSLGCTRDEIAGFRRSGTVA